MLLRVDENDNAKRLPPVPLSLCRVRDDFGSVKQQRPKRRKPERRFIFALSHISCFAITLS